MPGGLYALDLALTVSPLSLHLPPPALQVMATLEKTPFEKAFRRPYTVFTTNTIAKQFWKAVSHRIPTLGEGSPIEPGFLVKHGTHLPI